MAKYIFKIEKEDSFLSTRHKCQWEDCDNLATDTLVNYQEHEKYYCREHAYKILNYLMNMQEKGGTI